MGVTTRQPDFTGWATRFNVQCADGRTIRKNSFAHQDGEKVPMCWNHNHTTPGAVCGYSILHSSDDGVWCESFCNDTDIGRQALSCVQHGDISHYSIYANHVKQVGTDVIHGQITEVSLVFSGANPGAVIDNIITHDDEAGQCIEIFNDDEYEIELYHSDDAAASAPQQTTDDQQPAENNEEVSDDFDLQKIIESMTDEQQKAMLILIGMAVEDAGGGSSEEAQAEQPESSDGADAEYSDTEDNYMKTNIFDNTNAIESKVVMTVADQKDILAHANLYGTLSNAMKQNDAVQDICHGLANIEVLFPNAEAQNPTSMPEFIQRDQTWVNIVMNGTKKAASSRLKGWWADITADEARARGYMGKSENVAPVGGDKYVYDYAGDTRTYTDEQREIVKAKNGKVLTIADTEEGAVPLTDPIDTELTSRAYREDGLHYRDKWGNIVDESGNRFYKEEEVFGFLKRTTQPCTVYKKQRFDRDDMIDAAFDFIPAIKNEMKMMLNEEIARAILIGDGRSNSSNDKIREDCIRPIWKDDDMFNIKAKITVNASDDIDTKCAAVIRAAVKARKRYKGSGNPVLFTTEDWLTDMLLMEDSLGHPMYASQEALATKMRVSKIVTVPVMEGLSRPDTDGNTRNLVGIIVNLSDYSVGQDRGGQVAFFDDFDIDYNQQKYLIETRLSGSLMKPYSAITIEMVEEED